MAGSLARFDLHGKLRADYFLGYRAPLVPVRRGTILSIVTGGFSAAAVETRGAGLPHRSGSGADGPAGGEDISLTHPYCSSPRPAPSVCR
jgi:hypothetical protein